MWAFSRDGALPFSKILRKLSVRFGYIPLLSVWGCVLGAILLVRHSSIRPMFCTSYLKPLPTEHPLTASNPSVQMPLTNALSSLQ